MLAWPGVRDQAIRSCDGELPNPDTEDDVIAVFEKQPLVVVRAMNEIADQVAAGKVRSGWAVLRKRLEGATEARSDVTIEIDEREARVASAELWVTNAGVHY